jgi:hypothetical protein
MMKISKKITVLLIFLIATTGIGVALAASDAGPQLSINSNILAQPNSVVNIPIDFRANGKNISSLVFSIDYDQTWLTYDPGLANAIAFNLPGAFSGSCSPDISDTDGELDCTVFVFGAPPLPTLSDGTIATIKLRTLNPANTVTAPVLFSQAPEASFGTDQGQSVPGTAQDGSVRIGESIWDLFLPGVYKQPTPTPTNTPTATLPPSISPTPTPTATPTGQPPACSDLITNSGFENNQGWVIPATVYSARYTNAKSHSGSRSMLTGITLAADNRWSYSSAYQTVTIAGNAKSATLTFWNYPQSGEAIAQWALPLATHILGYKPLAVDMQYLAIVDEDTGNGKIVFWQLSNRKSWAKETIDLLDFKGKTIQIFFTSYNDGVDSVTSMYVDDVSLEVCK